MALVIIPHIQELAYQTKMYNNITKWSGDFLFCWSFDACLSIVRQAEASSTWSAAPRFDFRTSLLHQKQAPYSRFVKGKNLWAWEFGDTTTNTTANQKNLRLHQNPSPLNYISNNLRSVNAAGAPHKGSSLTNLSLLPRSVMPHLTSSVHKNVVELLNFSLVEYNNMTALCLLGRNFAWSSNFTSQ